MLSMGVAQYHHLAHNRHFQKGKQNQINKKPAFNYNFAKLWKWLAPVNLSV